MNEVQNENQEVEVYGYHNNNGQMVITPNVEFAHIMANKYGTENVYIIKN